MINLKGRILVFLLIVITLVSCIGCTKPATKPEKPKVTKDTSTTSSSNGEISDKNKEITLVKKANKTKYLLSNGIKFDTKNSTIDTKYGPATLLYTVVSGLKDKAIEDKLNKSIKSTLESSVKNFVNDEVQKGEQLGYFNSVVELNANNLLSVTLRNFYSEPIDGLLYRLTDGERLYLKDIFTAGSDYVPLVNRKVIESIIGDANANNYVSEAVINYEDYLIKPFSTISVDQKFAIAPSTLYIIFSQKDGVFSKSISIPIPLASIDDYVDVLDRYSGTERKTQIFTDLIVRHNNNFATSRSKIEKRSNGNIWVTYKEISGLRADDFEKSINATIKTEALDTLKEKILDSLVKGKTDSPGNDFVAIISSNVVYNAYGILSVARTVQGPDYSASKDLDNLYSIHSFDLQKKRALDTKTILNDYILKNNFTEAQFTNLVKRSLNDELIDLKATDIEAICSKVTTELIRDKSIIYFSDEEKTQVHVYFKQASINGLPSNIDCSFPLSSISKGAPEDFFGW